MTITKALLSTLFVFSVAFASMFILFSAAENDTDLRNRAECVHNYSSEVGFIGTDADAWKIFEPYCK